jgi:hypothetical protein
MKKIAVVLVLLIGIIAGCSSKKDEAGQVDSNTTPAIIEVSIQMPDTINPNEEVTIQALVTQGSEKVDDANEVKFEIEKVGQEDNETVEGQNDGKGIYSIKKTFTENGDYKVTAHVTARSMHSMPNKEFTVGTTVGEEGHEEGHSEGHDDQEAGHGHHDASTEIIFDQDTTFSTNKEETLKTTIKHEGSPLLGARVRYEVIADDGSTPEWIEAKEDTNGSYSAIKTFNKAGSYHVQIHVNKDEIHEHKVMMIDVK